MDRIVVVGGGVLGTMHAAQARRLGHEVVHLEREAGARGASVRNFGLIWVSGRAAGPELSLALRARARWEELAADIPAAGFRPHGSLTLAATEPELALLKEAAALPDAEDRGYELLDAAAARLLNPALRGRYAGALHCRRDAIVEPREVPRAIREHLLATAGLRHTPGCPAGKRSRPRRTRYAITRECGTAATSWCSVPAPRTPASPARTWPPANRCRSGGSGSR